VAGLGSIVFFVVAPGVVAGIVPWWLTGWRAAPATWWLLPVRAAGLVLISAGVGVLVHSFVRFVAEGAGTPAPIAPPSQLVVGGLYRYVRNPMYLSVLAIIVGQALWLVRPPLLLYAVVVLVAFTVFVRWYEEPALSRRFGVEYEAYQRAVPRWWPRLRPWKLG
jgi:protein-S-isoprenylcysteine O-methyltransferase Ste14